MRVNLRITEPLPSTVTAMEIQLDPEITSCKISDSLPGGFNALTVGMPEAQLTRLNYLPAPANIARFFHVEASIGSAKLFEGRIMRLHRPGGHVRGFSAVGYGLTAGTDDYYTSANAAFTTSGVILREALAKAPLLAISTKPGDWVDPGIRHQRTQFSGMSPQQIVDSLSKEGGAGAGSNAAPWDWAVWDGRSASWKPRIPPATAKYLIDLADVVIEEDATNLYGTVAVAYGSAKTITPENTAAGFQSKYGFRRAHVIQGSSISAGSAYQFRDTDASQHTQPDYAVTLPLAAGGGLRLTGGQLQEGHLIRSGEWLQVGAPVNPHVSAQTDPVTILDLPMLVILHKEFDAITEVTTLQVGAFPRDYYARQQEAWRIAAYTRNLQNPSTGAFL